MDAVRTWILVTAFLLATAGSHAASPYLHVDFWAPPEIDPLVDDLSAIPAQELKRTRQQYEDLLKKYRVAAAAVPNAGNRYADLQHEYDIVRLKIADVLPGMIERYEIDGPLKEILARFSQNFADFRTRMRNPAEPEYKLYDMHVSMTFVSMGVFLNQNPDIEARFKREINTPDTPLGIYSSEVDAVSAKLEPVKVATKAQEMVRDLEQRMRRIDAELKDKRQQRGI
jgi:hypothetical protein